MSEHQVQVFWDAIPATHVSGFQVAQAIHGAARFLGTVQSSKYYVDVNSGGERATSKLRSQLKCAGVTIVDTASQGREYSPTKMMLTDAFIFALDNRSPRILFVSADLDVCYAVSLLRQRGYEAYILCPRKSDSSFSHFGPPGDFDDSLLEPEDQPQLDQKSEVFIPEFQRAYSEPNYSLKKPSGNGQGHSEEPSNVLPAVEIDEFRQRFASRRPTLDTGVSNPFQSSRRASFPGTRLNNQTTPNDKSDFSAGDSGLVFGGAEGGQGKGKEKARELSPFQISASSFSSRTSSFDSYALPPSISTAPTSAFPFYSNSGSKNGDPKYQSLVYPSVDHIQRSTSEKSDISGAATVIAVSSSPPLINNGGAMSVAAQIIAPAIGIQHPSPRYEILPSLLPPPLHSPERIQVRATSLQHPSPVRQPNGTPMPTFISSSPTPRVLTPNRPPAPPPILTPARESSPLSSHTTPVPSTSTQAPAATPASTSISPPVASSSQSNPVPDHFQLLIDVLREYRDQGLFQVDRTRICQDLTRRNPRILFDAGTAEYRRPFVLYFDDAYASGIILNRTGNVELAQLFQ